jgi:hypothetical protein
MQQQLIPDAFKILSESYKKIGEIGVKIVSLNTSAEQQSYINQLIDVTMLYSTIMDHVVLNAAGTAVAGIQYQDVEVINDLLFSLREVADIPKLPIFPMPLTTYQFNFGDGGFTFDIGPGNLGDLIAHNGTVFTNLPMGPPGTVLTSTPTGLIWSANSGNGLPSGGTTNQYLRKNSNTSYDVVWDTLNLAKISDVTATASEVNILDGATLSTVELNYVDGVTSPIQIQLNNKMSNALPTGQFWVGVADIATPFTPTGDVTFNTSGVFAISAGAIVDADVNAAAAITRAKLANGAPNRLVINSSIGVMTDASAIAPGQVLISDSNGIPIASFVTGATLEFLDVTSSVQTQLNNKLSVTITALAAGDIITYNGSNWVNFGIGANGEVLTSNGSTVYWGSPTANGLPAGGTASQYLRKIDGSDYNTEWHTFVLSDITNISVSAAELNQLIGLTVGATQLNFLTGASGNIQLQLNNKQSRSLAYNALWVGDAGNLATELAPGITGQVLTLVGSTPQWQDPTPPGNVSGVSPTVVNTIVRWNDTGGASIKGSGIVIDDSDNISAVTSLTIKTAGAIRTGTTAANTLLLQAYDVDGTAYTTFATLTAGNTPTMDLATAVTIGGQYIYRIGGTDVSLADGGTGASLTDPGADRIMFWDDSAGAVTWLTVGSNLSITGTTLNATGGGGTSFQQKEEPGTTYTVVAGDDGYLIYFTSVTGCTVTIPSGLTANFSFTSARAEGAGVVNHVDDGTSVLHTINGDTDIQNENTAVTWAYKGSNDWYGFGALGAGGSGGGAVNSVGGTTNRITIGGTSTDPTVDIAVTYVGQTSITTLGTVATGTWNATTIGISKGGTGLTALGTANQLLRVNTGATALEYFTPTYISGNQTITLTGDVTGSGATGITTALATVNGDVGTFGSATQVAQFTVNGKGLITAAGNVTITPAATSITGAAALTEVDDTNVTLTLGGTPGTSLLRAVSITAGWTGQLAVTRGGTGLASVAQGDLLYGSATNTISALAKSATATRYLSNTGASNNPAWAQVDLTNGVTGVLPIVNGGTGTSSQPWWSLTGTSTLLGAATITSNAANQHIFNGTFTTTANTQFYQQYNPAVTIRGTASDTFDGFKITPTITTGANTQTINVLDLSGTYALGVTTGTVIRGILYNPTLTGNAPTGHTALAIGSGRIGLRNLTPTATLDITGEGTTAATFSMRIRDNTNVTLFQYGDDGFFRFGSLGSPPILGSAAQTSTTVSGNKAGGSVWLNTVNGTIISMTSGNNGGYAPILRVFGTYDPTLVGATAGMALSITPTLNQTGTAVASYTGILYNPTITALVGAHYGLIVAPAGANSGFGTSSPTAKIHIAAHTTAAGTAPIKLTSGTAMTTPEDGALEYHGSHLYFTIGSTRYQLDQQGGGGISGLTAGRVPYATSGTTIADEAGFEYDAANNRLTVANIRGAAPSFRLEAANQTTGAYLLLNDTGELLIRNQSTSDWLSIIDGTITGVGTAVSIRGGAGEAGATTIGSGDGSAGIVDAADTNVIAGNGYSTSGNGNGGSVLIQSGQRRVSGSGVDGDVVLDPRAGVLDIKIAPTSAAAVASTHKVPVNFNGSTYYVLVTNVP